LKAGAARVRPSRVPSPRDPKLRPYRVAMYVAFGALCAALFFQLVRSVTSDLYGSRGAAAQQQSATACLEDVDRLYGQLSARAVQPAPRGLESNELKREWDAWSRRWESEVEGVNRRCKLDSPTDPAMRELAEALDGIEELRRRLSRSGEDASAEARRVKESLEAARTLLRMR
jgi:hypothetical protein